MSVIVLFVIILLSLPYILKPEEHQKTVDDEFIEYNPTYYPKSDDALLDSVEDVKYVVDEWRIYYLHKDWNESKFWKEYGLFSVVFYVPKDNTTLVMNVCKILPDNEPFMFPLTLQKGDAYVSRYVAGSMSNTSTWYKSDDDKIIQPTLWKSNLSDSGTTIIPLTSSGRYTLCITGSVHGNSHTYSLKGFMGNEAKEALIEVYLSVKDQEENIILFGIIPKFE